MTKDGSIDVTEIGDQLKPDDLLELAKLDPQLRDSLHTLAQILTLVGPLERAIMHG